MDPANLPGLRLRPPTLSAQAPNMPDPQLSPQRKWTRASNYDAHRARIDASRYVIKPRVAQSCAHMYAANNATHELGISLGLYPLLFDPDLDLRAPMKRIVHGLTERLRGIPRRSQVVLLNRDALFLAGFYEPTTTRDGTFPTLHGVIALREDEEDVAREALADLVGHDVTPPLTDEWSWRPVSISPGIRGSFDLRPLSTPANYARHAATKAFGEHFTHVVTRDFVDAP